MEPNETISPSAYALLLMKSHTSIPYARETAGLLSAQSVPAPTAAIPLSADVDPADYWIRTMHFESRYWSINQLLADLTATNILEISSGFSFRGLDLSNKQPVFYIDTDLPNIINSKQHFVDALAADSHPIGHYELSPLNALDPEAFEAVVNKFPPGPLAIVNEGLLVYLDLTEKAQLCANIRKALLARVPPAGPSAPPWPGRPSGSRWITADIYIRRKEESKNDAWRQWSTAHGLEEKKFASFEEAEKFFYNAGFIMEKEATQDYSRLTSFSQFLKATGPQALNELRRRGRPRVHATWRLAPRP